nr:Hypothetical protein PLANC_4 [Enterococcus phage Planchet]
MKVIEGDTLIGKKTNWDVGVTKGDLYLVEKDMKGLYVSLGYSYLYIEGNEQIFDEFFKKINDMNSPRELYAVIFIEDGTSFLLGAYTSLGKARGSMSNSMRQHKLRVGAREREYHIKRYVLEDYV